MIYRMKMVILTLHLKKKYDVDVTDYVFEKGILYHLCRKEVVDKILKNGLSPRESQWYSFKNSPRIYFFCVEISDKNLEYWVQDTFFGKTIKSNDYVLLKIDVSKINNNPKFYGDPRLTDAVYTYDNINPEAIEKYKEIKYKHMDYLKEYYNINNGNDLQPLNEITLNRIINKHGEDGYVIVSANRSDKSNEENNKNLKSIITDLKKSPYGYCPVYGGYHGTDGVVDSFEPSFIIFNHSKTGDNMEFSDLKLFATILCRKYNQDSVLIKEPGERPYYSNADGEKVGIAVDDDVDINNPDNEYYTSLIKSNNLKTNEPEKLKRFSFNMQFECYANPNPATLNEMRRRREGYGEIILKFGERDLL